MQVQVLRVGVVGSRQADRAIHVAPFCQANDVVALGPGRWCGELSGTLEPCESPRREAERGWYAQRKGFDFPMLSCRAMRSKWPWDPPPELLDRPLVDLRAEYGFEVWRPEVALGLGEK